MKYFFGDPEQFVQQALRGIVAASGGRLSLLDGFPDTKVVIRSDWDPAQVTLVSGGGSGHEPSHAGFVGPGMLTAAVAGEIFASPSSHSVLAALLTVTGGPGTLLIVKNYTGDRLNFGLAAQQARARGCQVEVVVVGDDRALPDSPQPRGLAGTLFVHKIAGALAAQGACLQEVARTARQVASATVSLGLSLGQCHPPGHTAEDRLRADQVELGLGIHGEPGVDILPLDRAERLIEAMIQKLPDGLGRCALLLNNLGGVPPLEMGLLTELLLNSSLAERVELLIGPADLMTAYGMKGFSISLLPLQPLWREALQSPAPGTAWPTPQRPQAPCLRQLPPGLEPQSWPPSSNPGLAARLRAMAQTLIEAEADLNRLDARSGDGDTGTTLARAARRVLEELEQLPLAEPHLLLQALAQLCGQSMGGSSGVLLSLLLHRASLAWPQSQDSLARSLLAGLEGLPEDGGASVGQRTAVDALEPALRALVQGDLPAAARAARLGADQTATMARAHAGRAAAVSGRNLLGVVDPGAEAVARVFERLAE